MHFPFLFRIWRILFTRTLCTKRDLRYSNSYAKEDICEYRKAEHHIAVLVVWKVIIQAYRISIGHNLMEIPLSVILCIGFCLHNPLLGSPWSWNFCSMQTHGSVIFFTQGEWKKSGGGREGHGIWNLGTLHMFHIKDSKRQKIICIIL